MYSVNDCQVINLPKIHNSQGNITALNNGLDIPFDVKRVYYLYDVPSCSKRGGHAHYELEQYVVAASGSFTFVLNDGKNIRKVFLNNPSQALHIKKGIWREMEDFSGGSICLVLASMTYTENDYIRDFDDFLNYRKNL
jgi:hypothetical protein